MPQSDNAVRERLIRLRDNNYRDFQCGLMPDIPRDSVIGVRTPELRALEKSLTPDEKIAFTGELPHRYYEENNLHGLIINDIPDYDACVDALERFLPYVDNWATCDLLRPKTFAKHPSELPALLAALSESPRTFTARFAVEGLMTYYLDAFFSPEYPAVVARLREGEYYLDMMKAWYFATALAKRWDDIIPYLTGCRLDITTHNMALRKAIESRRITDARKIYLRTLKK